jgi:O-antigen ligase
VTALSQSRGASIGWLAGLGFACVGVGVVAGVDPKYGVAGALALGFIVAVLGDLVVGVAMFTTLSFLDNLNVGGGLVSFDKVAGLLLFASWVASRTAGSRRNARAVAVRHPAMLLAILFFLGWSTLSSAWAESSGDALVTAYRDALDLLLIPIVYGAIRDRRDIQIIVGGYLAGAIVSAIYGLISPPSATSLAAGRLTGSLGEANQQATVLVAAIVLAVGFAALSRRSTPLRLLAVVAVIVSFVGLVSTLSRAGLFAFAFVLLAGVLFGGRWRRRSATFLLVGVTAVVLYFVALAPSSALHRVVSGGTSGRSTIWTVGWRMFEANPVIGVGAGNFQVSSVHYLERPGLVTAAFFIIDIPKVAHNIYLEQLATLGVPGLIALVGIFIAGVSAALRAAHIFERLGDRPMEIMSRCSIVGLFAFLTADFFASELVSKQLWLVFALAPALLKLADIESEGASRQADLRPSEA